jgi:hypothetical protein
VRRHLGLVGGLPVPPKSCRATLDHDNAEPCPSERIQGLKNNSRYTFWLVAGKAQVCDAVPATPATLVNVPGTPAGLTAPGGVRAGRKPSYCN